MTSAGNKNSYAYDKMIEVAGSAIINPQNAFVWGCSYRIPMMHGLLDERFINEIKSSSTYKDDSFAREYESIWVGGNSESWFDYERLRRYRIIKNPEFVEKSRGDQNFFYLMSVDVARLSCQTVVSVFKVFPDSGYRAILINMFVLGRTDVTKHFMRQAIDLKKIIRDFNPREVVIDGTGLGVGLLDYMVQENYDNGVTYPAYGSFNNEDYLKIQPKDCEKIIYVLKANTTLNSQIHNNCFTRLNSGKVRFLIRETEAKTQLLATKAGQKMNLAKRTARLMPHEMTSKLFDELGNLRAKQTGLNTSIELINTRYTKDKFSSFEYGLWRIKEIEEAEQIRARRRGTTTKRKLFFYSSGG